MKNLTFILYNYNNLELHLTKYIMKICLAFSTFHDTYGVNIYTLIILAIYIYISEYII